ncbi:GNAT family N-acetyltransferase [Paenisporosarcina quisquiliarum]|uniref:GNAT family N-acetyltransferase n=1 Tax=Paenisporosarcina quisquiliarum TaxID=365346 RepID=A0A9X3RD57_9BACL|nr:GNAT family N-acetyltransferase [Paenisporosarcina quisquiliarum]MCZ8537465.1 GNAT family N-acetyltransferase [Paenisporosarcina quisquiliarum]
MKLYHIRKLDNLLPYKKNWDHILEVNQNDNPFIEFQWVENWWRYIGVNRAIEFIVVEKDEKVIAFFPFQITRKWKTTLIEFIGRGEANYMDFVVYNHLREEVIEFVFDELKRSMPKCIFNLHGLLSSSPSTNILSLYLAKRNCEPTIFSVVTPFIKTQELNLEDYLKKRRKIHGLDRREKRLKYLGEVTQKTSSLDEIDCVFALHDKRWKQKMDTSQFTSEEHKKFYRALLNINEGPMNARVEGLYLDNQMIAFSYELNCRGRMVGYVIGHDPDFDIYGPGTILDKELIANSQKNSIRIFDLSIGYEPYKFEWNTGVDYTNNFIFSSNEWQAQMVYQLIRGKGHIHAVLKKNYKIVLFKREFIGRKLYFLRNATFKEWRRAIWRLLGKIYFQKSVDIYQQTNGNEVGREFQSLFYPEARKRHHNLSQLNKWFYKGFKPYGDSTISLFWMHPRVIRVDEVDYLQPLPKNSAFIAEWQIHNLSSMCSFLRQENKNVHDIYVSTSKKDPLVEKHLQQLGFTHVKSVKKKSVFSKSSTQVSAYSTPRE